MDRIVGTVSLNSREFAKLSSYIHTEFGIKMPQAKKTLLESRLQKRLRKLEFGSFKDYCEYLFSSDGRAYELPHFISQITTNKTDFFREPDHFEYMSRTALPTLLRDAGSQQRHLNIWSAGCSTGEEPYTLAIVLSEFKERNPDILFTYKIIATDISPEVIKTAQNAVYHHDTTIPIPIQVKRKYFMKSKDKSKPIVKVVPELRQQIQYKQLNFMDKDYNMKNPIDMIFCRNVLIYFDRPTQEKVLMKLCRCLRVGGYFYQGHSESTQGMNLPLKSMAPTIYKRV